MDVEVENALCESELLLPLRLPLPLPPPLPLHPLLEGTMIESESSQLPGQQPDELAESSGQDPGQHPEELSLEDEELSLLEEELSEDEDELSLEDNELEDPLLLLPKELLEERALRKSARGSASRSSRRTPGASAGRAAAWTRMVDKRVVAETALQGPRDEGVREDIVDRV